MELNILNQEGNTIQIEFIGEDHTLLGVLVETLRADPDVKFAVYSIDHPLIGKPMLTFETAKGKPQAVLKKAAQTMKAQLEAIDKQIK